MDDLKADIKELAQLEATALRPKVKEFLNLKRRQLEADIIIMEDKLIQSQNKECVLNDVKKESSGPSQSSRGIFSTQITTYGWHQSDKFIELYLTDGFKDIQNHGKDKVTCSFTELSVKLTVLDFNGKHHELYIKNLYEKIIPEESSYKVKNDKILVMLRKKSANKTWAYVTKQEKMEKEKTKSIPTIDKDKDPNESMMDMLKQMYDQGDDEMKRTIAQAWSQSKQKTGF